jgi:probable O-glycosylation ligase (exosortase A-associated)
MKGLIFTYLLTYGGAIAALFNPFVGLLVYVCFAVLRPDFLWFWSVEPGNYSRIVAAGLLIGWAAHGFGILQVRSVHRHPPGLLIGWAAHGFGSWKFGRARAIIASLVVLLLWSVVAANWAPDSAKAWLFVETFAKIVLPVVVGITLIDSIDKLKQLAWVIVLSEGYLAYEFNLSYYEGYNRLRDAGFGSMDNNSNAIALVTCLGLAFFLGLSTRAWWRKGLAFAAAALMGHAVLISNSRGGMLALLVTAGVTFLLLPKRLPHYLAFAAAVLLGIRLAGPQVIERFQTVFSDPTQRDAAASGRLQLWAACWDTMLNQPLGVGPDQFPVIAPRYGFPRGKEAHNLWLQFGAELGFLGMALLLLFYGLCIARLWRYTRERQPVDDPWVRHFARMVIAALAGFAVSATFVSLKLLEPPYYVVLLGAGVLKLSTVQRAKGEEEEPNFAEEPDFAAEPALTR